jgi:hypothetical protein
MEIQKNILLLFSPTYMQAGLKQTVFKLYNRLNLRTLNVRIGIFE